MKKSKIRAVCFDMWGTLCEGGGGKEWFLLQRILGANSIDNKIFHNLGLESLLLHPWSLRDGIKNLAKKLTDIKPLSSSVILSDSDVTSGESKDLIIEKAYSTWWNLVEKSRIYPETYEVLDKLEQYSLKLFIISNTDSESFYYEVNKFNLKKYFEKFFISAEIGSLKHQGKMFTLIQKYLHLPKNRILLVDDSLDHGVLPARKFGWKALWVARGKKGEDRGKIENLRGVIEFLIFN